jgi:fatty acid desaturase
VFSNVLGMDDDLGFGVMRVTRDQPWRPSHLLQPLQNLFLAATFEWAIAVHDFDLDRSKAEKATQAKALLGKIARQAVKRLRALSGAQPIPLAQNPGRQRNSQPAAQPLGVHRDLLWAFP